MTSLLQPGYTLTLGNQQWTQQVMRIDLMLAPAPSIDALMVEFPGQAQIKAEADDPADLTLNNGEKEEAVFSGIIDSIRHTATTIRVRALNSGAALAQTRPAVTFEQVSAGTVIRKLCDEAGVDAGDVEEGVSLAYYAADPSRTALDHIARVAGWSGALARISPDNRIEAVVINATQAEIALKYGRELKSIQQRKSPSAIQSFTVAGESGVGDTASQDALRPTTDFFTGNRPAGPSKSTRWRSEPALRTAKSAASAAAAVQRLYNATRERGTFTSFLQPGLRPGTVLEIQELPDGLPNGPLCIARVSHHIGDHGALTRAAFFKGGDAFDPAALLGALLGSLGSLL